MRFSFAALMTLVVATSANCLPAADITAERSEKGDSVTIKIDGQLFTEYLVRSGSKPILWPIMGPTGKPVTRAYPMVQQTKETRDHNHHRSLWFTHGKVNGVDFWAEKGDESGITKHREFVKVEGGRQAVVATRNDWLAPGGKKVCEDLRTLTFGADDNARWIDFDIAIKASEGPVVFGDTKEGTFALRVAESLRVDSKQGARIVNSEGQVNGAAWGKRAAWVDDHGPLDGETVGIAILNHPSSFRYPTYWHVRTYGLFAANPFGVKDFSKNEAEGSYNLPKDETLTLRYRVLLHRGDEKQGRVAEAFKAYAAQSR